MTPALSLLAALNVAALGWALAPLLLASPLERRARQFGRARHSGTDWRAEAQALTEAIAGRAPLAFQQRADAAADAAGWPEAAAAQVIAASLILPVLLTLLALFFDAGAMLALLLAFAGAGAPWLYARNMALRRRTALAQGLPDALDLLVICAESGLTLDAALARTGRELAPARPAIAGELATTAVELGFLPRRADAFANLARRVPLPAVRALTDTLIQTERFGTPLATDLGVMADESRSSRLLAAEARAARLPALMTVPMIGFVLPPLFVVLIGPAIIDALK